ncbi:MAG TPA: hypothetical protein VFE52_11975 [Devosia sp.]|jgi:hypothetical protein|nr:hypothetical protein [Devosia sp.]
MKFATALAAVLLAGTFAAPAFAQEIIGDIAVPQGERESVRNHCATLMAASRAEIGEAAQGQGDHEENPNAKGGEVVDNAAGQGNAEGITDLTSADDASPSATVDASSSAMSSSVSSEASSSAEMSSSQPSSASSAEPTGTVDLAAITLEDCQAAAWTQTAE